MKHYDKNVPLAELFKVQVLEYENVDVELLPFSVRIINLFKRNKIFKLTDLLQVSVLFLDHIPGLGKGSVDQILFYLEGLFQQSESKKIDRNSNIDKLFVNNTRLIVLGDFTFVDDMALSIEQNKQLIALKNAYDDLGKELVRECMDFPEKIYPIISALSGFYNRVAKLNNLEQIFGQMPAKRRSNSAKYYIDAYSFDESIRKRIRMCYNSDNDRLDSIIKTIDADDKAQIKDAQSFLNWCTYNIADEIETIFEKLYSHSRIQTVIEARANKITLNDIGNNLKITRERVRQIESKAKRLFTVYQARIKIIQKIYADQNGNPIIKLEDLEEIGGNNAAVLIYLLKDIKGDIFAYDHQLDAFVVGDNDLSSKIQDYLDTLPEVLHKKELPVLLDTACEEYDLDREYVEKALHEVYSITGDVYHRTRLSLAKIYDIVLRKYYANGIHIYSESEIKTLRQHIYDDYGDISLPSADRAIAARISSICILSGRGVYIPKKKSYISDELAKKLFSYIIDSSSPILFVGNIYSVFIEELMEEGVDNRYYLQGILRELFGNKLFFRRDYVSRDKEFTSIYSSIVAFIKQSKYPVKKDEIKVRFKGVTDIVITMATSDDDVLNYFGEYIHSSNIIIHESEKQYLSEYLSSTLADGDAHHIKDIYSEIICNRPEIFSRNAVVASYSAFSVLEYIFRDDYQFSRPYIAMNDVEIGRPNERLHEYLYSMDKFSVTDITDFAKEIRLQIQSLIEYINSLNDKFLMIDIENLEKIEDVGITKNIADEIETHICSEIKNTTPIRELRCISKFPTINVPWNEWLIYSLLKKWSVKLNVTLSSSQLRQSIPLVSFVGNVDTSKYKDITPIQLRIKIDNMDEIDDLLSEYIADELLEEI